MRIKNFISIAFISTFGLISCSKESVSSVEVNEPEKSEFKKLATINIASTEGTNQEIADSRTPGSINSNGYPTDIYYKSYVNLITTEADGTHNEVTHNFEVIDEEQRYYNYDVYYKFIDGLEHDNEISDKGTISLASKKDGSNSINIKLTSFLKKDLEKLENTGDKLYGLDNVSEKGSILYYLSYVPTEVGQADENNVRKLILPTIVDSKYNFLLTTNNPENYTSLYNEIEDDYFLSKEILISATEEYIYVLETIKNETDSNNGYRLLRRYDITKEDNDKIHRMKIDMSRLTTIINASFVINDTHSSVSSPVDEANSYYKEDNIESSIDNFESLYVNNRVNNKVDLGEMQCPYATIDGIPSVYRINDTTENNTTDPCRFVLWAKDLVVTGIDGNQYDKKATFGNVSIFDTMHKEYSGLGIQGNSYSVCFKGSLKSGSLLCFYVTVPYSYKDNATSTTNNINILISTKMHFSDGSTFNLVQNTLHHFTLLVDAKVLGKTIADMINQQASGASRANSNDFVELRVPSENLIIN